MNAGEWGLNEQDAERLRTALRDDEQLVLVAKPKARMHWLAVLGVMVPGVILAGFVSFFAYKFGAYWWVVMLIFSPGWVFALALLSKPWRYRWRMERTLYVLTDKRAIVFEQQGLWKKRCICWPLFPGLIKKVTKDDDMGSLIFDYEIHGSLSDHRKEHVPQPVGFLNVPQPEQVRQLVEAQVAAIPADQAPFSYRPSVLRAPVPRLDAWGNPLARQPRPERGLVMPLIIFGAIWILFSLAFTAIGVQDMRTESRLEAEGVETTATVLRVRKHTSGGGGRRSRSRSVTYYPTLQFTDTAGQVHTVEYGYNTDNYSEGSELTVVYHPAAPETLRIVEDGWSPGTQFTLVGSFFTLIGCGLVFLGIKRKTGK